MYLPEPGNWKLYLNILLPYLDRPSEEAISVSKYNQAKEQQETIKFQNEEVKKLGHLWRGQYKMNTSGSIVNLQSMPTAVNKTGDIFKVRIVV